MAEAIAPTEDNGLIFACILDGTGGANLAQWQDVETWRDDDHPIWVHLNRESEQAQRWLRDASGLTGATVDALLAEETRPRVFAGKRGFVTILRGINLNPEADDEDMVAMRMWSDGVRVITIRQDRLITPRDVLSQLLDPEEVGPATASDLYERLIYRITERMGPAVDEFDVKLDDIEAALDLDKATQQRKQLSELRQKMAGFRRYISPQKEALTNLLIQPPTWLSDESRLALRETADRLIRYIEEIDAGRERASVIKDDIANQIAESSNKTLYILAIISAIFLPLGFLTGLLGINVGGMPGVENEYAFWIFCAVMAFLLAAELVIFRKLKWL